MRHSSLIDCRISAGKKSVLVEFCNTTHTISPDLSGALGQPVFCIKPLGFERTSGSVIRTNGGHRVGSICGKEETRSVFLVQRRGGGCREDACESGRGHSAHRAAAVRGAPTRSPCALPRERFVAAGQAAERHIRGRSAQLDPGFGSVARRLASTRRRYVLR